MIRISSQSDHGARCRYYSGCSVREPNIDRALFIWEMITDANHESAVPNVSRSLLARAYSCLAYAYFELHQRACTGDAVERDPTISSRHLLPTRTSRTTSSTSARSTPTPQLSSVSSAQQCCTPRHTSSSSASVMASISSGARDMVRSSTSGAQKRRARRNGQRSSEERSQSRSHTERLCLCYAGLRDRCEPEEGAYALRGTLSYQAALL